MKDADDANSLCIHLVKDHVLSFFHAAKPRFNRFTAAPNLRILSDYLATGLKRVDITMGLCHAPCANCVGRNVAEILFREE